LKLAVVAILGEENPERAATLFGADEALREQTGVAIDDVFFNFLISKSIETIHRCLDETSFNTAWQKGKKMSIDEVVKYVLGDN